MAALMENSSGAGGGGGGSKLSSPPLPRQFARQSSGRQPHPCFDECEDTSVSQEQQICEDCGGGQNHGIVFEERIMMKICQQIKQISDTLNIALFKAGKVAIDIIKSKDTFPKFEQYLAEIGVKYEVPKRYHVTVSLDKLPDVYYLYLRAAMRSSGNEPYDINLWLEDSEQWGDETYYSHFPEVNPDIIAQMQKEYGVGISCKLRGEPCNLCMGDFVRVSRHCDNTWSCVVGVHEQKENCKCIIKVWKGLFIPNDRRYIFNEFTHSQIKAWDLAVSQEGADWETITNEVFGAGKQRKTQLPNISINPKRGSAARPAQCSFNQKQIKNLIEYLQNNHRFVEWNKEIYPSLWMPIRSAARKMKKNVAASGGVGAQKTKQGGGRRRKRKTRKSKKRKKRKTKRRRRKKRKHTRRHRR